MGYHHSAFYRFLLVSCLLISIVAFQAAPSFLAEQKRYARVRTAINEKEELLKNRLKKHRLDINNFHALLVGYKEEGILEVYVKAGSSTKYTLYNSYPICARSGTLGPKRKQGDRQVPEGLYYIDRYNPASSYYLSLGINYPNLADKRKSPAANLGGDIFIHGACATLGCLPMTDNYIKEIYLLSILAKNNGQAKVPVYLFPFKMTSKNLSEHLAKGYANQKAFWQNLKTAYDAFQQNKKELSFSVDDRGDYRLDIN